MKVLVTGATGFIGSHLVEALLRKGHAVRVLVRNPAGLPWPAERGGLELSAGCLEDRASLARAVRGVDMVYHAAGVVKARRKETYFAVNTLGTERLLEAALAERERIRRFLLVSSQAAVGPSPDFTPLEEDARPRPITPYGESKRAAEEAVLRHADRLPVTVLRPTAVYGPRDRQILVFFRLARKGIIPIPGFGRRRISLVYVEDFVRAALLAGDGPEGAGKVYFISGGDHDWGEIARCLRAAVGRGKAVRVPVTILKAGAAASLAASLFTGKPAALHPDKARELCQPAWLCSNRRAREELGFRPAWSLDRGLARTAAWYREAGWLA